MHIGTFTREGTWDAAERSNCRELADLGVTCLEVMPVADFAGTFGWGYDGVDLFAPTRLYGAARRLPPLRRRCPRAGHRRHPRRRLQPLRPRRQLPQGILRPLLHRQAQDRLGRGDQLRRQRQRPGARVLPRQRPLLDRGVPPRRLPLRRHAGHLRRLAGAHPGRHRPRVRGRQAGAAARSIWSTRTSRSTRASSGPPEQGGYGLDALWNDDFHHSAMVALTGRNEAYYTDHPGSPQEFVSAAKYGLPLPGAALQLAEASGGARRRSTCRRPRSSTSSRTTTRSPTPAAACGRTSSRSPGQYRAMTALLLLLPQTPMLFQGQEFAASSPFHYFADHNGGTGQTGPRGAGQGTERVPQRRDRGDAGPPCSTRPTRTTFERVEARPASGRGRSTPSLSSCTSDLLRLRAKSRSSARAAARRRRRGGARAGGIRPALLRRARWRRQTACCWSTSAPTCTWTSPPNRCWRRRRDAMGGPMVQRRPALRRQRHARPGHRERRLAAARPLRVVRCCKPEQSDTAT